MRGRGLNGRGARRKGVEFERSIAREFAQVFGKDHVRRGLQYRDGAEAPDVVAPCFWIECKRMRQTNPRAALRQAIAASQGKGFWPVAVCKDDGQSAFVALTLEDFLDLVGEWWAGRNEVRPSSARDAAPRDDLQPTLMSLTPDQFLELMEQWWTNRNAA